MDQQENSLETPTQQLKLFDEPQENRTASEFFLQQKLPPRAVALRILGVDYVHVKTSDEGDLYVTKFGWPFLEHLKPESWYEKEWFEQSREKLIGTSTVYKVRTKPIRHISKELVVKWCRVGEQVPIDTFTLNKFVEADFNSPYEEFALVMELRDDRSARIVRTHKPMAIFVPAERLKLWQTGRSHSKMAQKKAKYRDVELDIYRQYILIYEWVKGVSVTEVVAPLIPDKEKRMEELRSLTFRVADDLHRKGFQVLDMKPEHIIVRPRPDGSLPRERGNLFPYALVDFELLTRTPEHEERVKAQRRAQYLKKQRDRFVKTRPADFPPHLHPVNVHGVDYVFGHTESTGGMLWVVGNDPGLFDYFQPERWRRTPRTQLSRTNQVFHTLTKDKINLVWKVSRVGEIPDVDPADPQGQERLRYGFNSPFEEFSRAFELDRNGVATIYPRAIYMTGQESANPEDMTDRSRYESHKTLLTPDGHPVLRSDHNYITVWGYWNGLDEFLARLDTGYCRGVNAQQALDDGLITKEGFEQLLNKVRRQLSFAGMEDLDLKGTHFLLTLNPGGSMMKDSDGTPTVRLCNFESIRKKMPLLGGG
jgi:hypothetical protein